MPLIRPPRFDDHVVSPLPIPLLIDGEINPEAVTLVDIVWMDENFYLNNGRKHLQLQEMVAQTLSGFENRYVFYLYAVNGRNRINLIFDWSSQIWYQINDTASIRCLVSQ